MLHRPIDGTWFEFYHHSQAEGAYWNPACRAFTEEQWRQKLQEIRALGMEYVVLMCTSLAWEDRAESYFDGGPYPFPEDMVCKNPMPTLFDECAKLGLKVFVSCGFYGDWTRATDNMRSDAVRRRAFAAMERLYGDFGGSPAFYGWYLPDEVQIDGGFPEFFIDYVNDYRAKARSLAPDKPLLVAPYWITTARTDEAYVRQLERMDCEIIAYQDGVGIRNGGQEQAADYYAALRRVHDRAGRSALWADVEMFRFEGKAYQSALLPGDIERIEAQLNAASAYVDKVLIYQYQGLMCPPDSLAPCGHADAAQLYSAYVSRLPRRPA